MSLLNDFVKRRRPSVINTVATDSRFSNALTLKKLANYEFYNRTYNKSNQQGRKPDIGHFSLLFDLITFTSSSI